jgi:hypothetical protein
MKLNLKPKKPGIAEAIQEAWIVDHPQYARGTKPPRRIKHDYLTQHKYVNAELIRESIANKVEYQLSLKPQEILIGKQTFSSNFSAILITPCAIGVFKAALKEFLPSLDEEEMASWEDDNFRLSHVSTHKYLKFDTEAEAMRALWTLFTHCKITLDCAEVFPKRKGQSRVPAQMVFADESRRSAFRIVLPAGEISVYVIRDGDYPSTLQDVNETDHRMAMRANMRTLLCFEITNDLAMFHYESEDGAVSYLPDDYRQWSREHLARDPNKTFWNQALYDLWLNVDLATTEDEVRREGLLPDKLKVLNAYMAGKSMFTPYLLPERHDDAMAVHEVLVRKSGVNILTPWAVNKLHHGKILRPMMDEGSLFDLGADPDFKAHTLCKENIKGAIEALCASMEGVPGWSFKPME